MGFTHREARIISTSKKAKRRNTQPVQVSIGLLENPGNKPPRPQLVTLIVVKGFS